MLRKKLLKLVQQKLSVEMKLSWQESLLRAFEGHAAAETITSAVRAVEIEVIAITSSGGITQGNPSKSDSRIDSILFDLSPSTRCYTRRVP
jgi:hypothetical protein